MPVFAVTAPHLTPDQHYELESLLMEAPETDAFFTEEGSLGTEVTCAPGALPAIVSIVYRWAAAHERGQSLVHFHCPGGVTASVAEHSPAEVVAFLAGCGDDPAELRGLTKRLADDGVHEGR